jgi:hypothetical protein
MTVLERIFGVEERVSLLRFFIFHPEEDFTLRELQRRLRRRSPRLSRAVRELAALGCLVAGVRAATGESVYRVDPTWLLFPEFRALFTKGQLLLEHDLVRRLQRAGRLRFFVLTGLFVGDYHGPTDVLLVGQINRRQVAMLLRRFERDLNREIKYTVMTPPEYRYRKDVGDRFLYDILERRHVVVVDTLQRRTARRPAAAAPPARRRGTGRHRARRLSARPARRSSPVRERQR